MPTQPSAYWRDLRVPQGANPRVSPAPWSIALDAVVVEAVSEEQRGPLRARKGCTRRDGREVQALAIKAKSRTRASHESEREAEPRRQRLKPHDGVRSVSIRPLTPSGARLQGHRLLAGLRLQPHPKRAAGPVVTTKRI